MTRMSVVAALVVIGVFGSFLLFVWHRLAVAPRWGSRWVPVLVGLLLLALLAAVLEGFDVWGGRWSPATMRPVAWTGQAFLATCLYLFLGLVPVAVVSGALWVLRWRHDHGRAARQRLNRVAAPLVAVVALGVTGYGAWEAAHPSGHPVELSSPELPAEFDGTRVALVTDLHAGAVRSADFTRGVVDLVNAQHPDLVVIAGDLEDGYAARYGPELEPLRDLEAPLGVYATTGNHEIYQDTANWVRAFEDLGLTVLKNQSVDLERGGATITLAGVHDHEGSGEFAPDPRPRWPGSTRRASPSSPRTSPARRSTSRGAASTSSSPATPTAGSCGRGATSCPSSSRPSTASPPWGTCPSSPPAALGAWGPAIRVGAPPELPVVTLRRS